MGRECIAKGRVRYVDILHIYRYIPALHENGCVRRSILWVYTAFDDFSGSLALSESKTQEASIYICIDYLCTRSDIPGKIVIAYFIAYIILLQRQHIAWLFDKTV